MQECCENKENREWNEEKTKSKCKVCGRNHYRLEAETGNLSSDFRSLFDAFRNA